MGRICAVVLDYFGIEKTERCLMSLVGQGISEVRVVDNSGDSTYQARLSNRVSELASTVDYALLYAANQENLGFGKAINRALSLAAESGPWECYLLINNDAQAEQGMVPTLEQALYADPQVGMVAPYTRDGDETICGFWYQRHTGLVSQHRIPGSFYYLSGSCLLIRSELAESGLFDESFFMYGEDVELSWRLHRQGFVPRCIPGALLHHAGIGSSHPGQLFYEYHMVRGHMLLAARLSRIAAEYPLLWLGRMLILPSRAVVRCARFRNMWPLGALGLACLPRRSELRPKKAN